MDIGLKDINGSIYYFQESGAYIGAAYTGEITLNGVAYSFDGMGRLVNAVPVA